MKTQLELAEKSFSQVLAADIHLDNKASRTLGAMAFLTAASAAIFAQVYSPEWPSGSLETALKEVLSNYPSATQLLKPETLTGIVNNAIQGLERPYSFFGVEWSVLFFGLYLLFVLTGAMLYLGAIGPTLNLPDLWRDSDSREQNSRKKIEIDSLLFYHKIAETEPNQWEQHWRSTPTDKLNKEMAEDFWFECRLLAEKAEEKRNLMSYGNAFFRVAFFFWIALIARLLAYEPWSIWSFTLAGWSVVFLALAVTTSIATLRKTRPRGVRFLAYIREPLQKKPVPVPLLLAAVSALLAFLIAIAKWFGFFS